MPERLCSDPITNAEANRLNSSDAFISRRMADCMVANLPWGENAFQYYNENSKLIAALGKDLQPGCECAFVVQGGGEYSLDTEKEMLSVLRKNGFVVSDTVVVGAEGGSDSSALKESKAKVLDRGRKDIDQDEFHSSIRRGFAVIFAHRST